MKAFSDRHRFSLDCFASALQLYINDTLFKQLLVLLKKIILVGRNSISSFKNVFSSL